MIAAINKTVKRTQSNPSQIEDKILCTIVDAILETEAELEEATLDQWSRILVDACHRRKGAAVGRHASLMAA